MAARPTTLRRAVASLASARTPHLPLDRRRHISAYGYTQAKALVYSKHGEPKDVLDMHTYSLSPPHGKLLTLRTLAAPLNPADINQIQGTYASQPAFTSALGTPQPSAVPGNEGVFEVVSAGAGATAAASKGDWVVAKHTGLGTWRTHLQVSSDQVLRVDKHGLQPVHAATVAVNPVTAWRLLRDFAPLEPRKDWVVQNGANSGVGRAVLQLCRAWGINNIAVVRARPAPELEALAKELTRLGATHVVSDEELQTPEFRQRCMEWTAGGRQPVKLALNCVGGKPGVALAKLLAPRGVHVTYGAMAKQPLALPASLLIFREIEFKGFWVSKWGDAHPEAKAQTIADVLDMVRRGEFEAGPTDQQRWEWDTPKEQLVEKVQATLEGFRSGKGVFVFGDT